MLEDRLIVSVKFRKQRMTSANACAGGNSPEDTKPRRTDFSIEHILTRAGNNISKSSGYTNTSAEQCVSFSWLHCTRYCPPKLPRSQKKDGPQRRQLGRHPRIPFSSQQLAVLEEKYKETPYLSSAEVTQLSRTLHLAAIRVKIWFQNRRARERRERNEQEVQQLKSYSKNEQRPKRTESPIAVSLPATLSPIFVDHLNEKKEERSTRAQPSKPNDFKSIACFLEA